jgi:hypothetical protein
MSIHEVCAAHNRPSCQVIGLPDIKCDRPVSELQSPSSDRPAHNVLNRLVNDSLAETLRECYQQVDLRSVLRSIG